MVGIKPSQINALELAVAGAAAARAAVTAAKVAALVRATRRNHRIFSATLLLNYVSSCLSVPIFHCHRTELTFRIYFCTLFIFKSTQYFSVWFPTFVGNTKFTFPPHVCSYI